ncbi:MULTISPECIES: thiolase family protein [Roseobacteraceae]|uniref:3-ketoacyl-CoA thiolase n=1 Tax=Pseudosulfitobacter pseudonitzschiae TaxID=1402135 RepID=A0A221K7M1_9RHOB|nr:MULTISPECIES: thiolase family protein [Roseobacteraceae]ASM75001.1 3-ketoacyl-CoA thiolase [Pseudosulfitobacter pseudonitzschiae]
MVSLSQKRPVYVIGVGMHPYQFASDTLFIEMGLTAVRAALDDAGVAFPEVESAFIGCTGIGMAAGRIMFNHLGSTGLACTQVENASASGSSAFQQAVIEVAAGRRDVSIAVGVDKYGDQVRAAGKEHVARLSDTATIPLVKYALMAEYLKKEKGLSAEDLAMVASKNHTNASKNPFAQFRKPRTVEQVLSSTLVAGTTTSLMCCPRGEGAAAAIVASEDAIRRLGIAGSRPIRVTASALQSEMPQVGREIPSVTLAQRVAEQVYDEAGISAADLDCVELHDAFAIEEILYTETFGLAPKGAGQKFLQDGSSAIGGRCCVNSSGGLIGQGHPLGPTGLGQIHEITRQLRGENGVRQQPDARIGMAHMIGLGSISIAHILQRD